MFDDFLGLPLHVLIVHLTVVLLPVTAVTALAYVALRRWRWLLRWPLALLGVGSAAVTFVTVRAGKAFKEQLGSGIEQVIATHEARGELLLIFVLVFAVVALAAAVTLGGPSLLESGRGAREGAIRPVQLGVSALLVIAALLVLVQVFLTGDAGSRAVWENV